MIDGTKRFFAFARERHNIYLRKQTVPEGAQLTDDPVLHKYKFTNVFRELDRTTVWFRVNVRDRLKEKPEVLLATVVFRMINRISCGEAMFNQMTLDKGKSAYDLFRDDGDVRHLRRAIKALVGKHGPYVTGAYTTPTPPGYLKLDGILKVIEHFEETSNWEDYAKEMMKFKGGDKLQHAWKWLREFWFFGNFNAYEIITDLRYTALLRDADDIMTWCNVGPGARRGLNRIAGREYKDTKTSTENMLDEIRLLLKQSKKIEYWPQNKEAYPNWEMRDVEHTLCEFDKYTRVQNGEGRPRGVYR